MPKPIRCTLPVLLLAGLLLTACGPLVPSTTDQDQTHIAALQEKLRQLQAQLATMQKSQAEVAHSWQAIGASQTAPAGHRLYTYLLYSGAESTEGLKRLATLLDLAGAAPPPTAEADSASLLLIPLAAGTQRPTIENYDFTAAQERVRQVGFDLRQSEGPLLLATAAPLSAQSQPSLLLIPGAASSAELDALLASFRREIPAGGDALANLSWALLWQAAPGSLVAERRGDTLYLHHP